MPYGGTTTQQDEKMDPCVQRLMADASFKPRKGKTKKESAIAVCKTSISLKEKLLPLKSRSMKKKTS